MASAVDLFHGCRGYELIKIPYSASNLFPFKPIRDQFPTFPCTCRGQSGLGTVEYGVRFGLHIKYVPMSHHHGVDKSLVVNIVLDGGRSGWSNEWAQWPTCSDFFIDLYLQQTHNIICVKFFSVCGGIWIKTHWGRDKMTDIYQTIFSNAFSGMKIFKFRFKFRWNLFSRDKLAIFQHWFK